MLNSGTGSYAVNLPSELANRVGSAPSTEILFTSGAEVKRAAGQHVYDVYGAQNSFLLGKVLTTIDAAVLDKQQNKAVKDIIKQQFREQEKWVYQMCCDGQLVCAAGEQMPPT